MRRSPDSMPDPRVPSRGPAAAQPAPGRSPSTHPLLHLVAEHETLRAVLERMGAEIQRMQCSFELRLDFWMRVLEWLELSADRDHHAREEQVLFPLLQEAGLGKEHGLLRVVANGHEAARAIRGRMVQAVASNDVRALAVAARAYHDALVQHVEEEERVLFPLAMELLDEADTARLEEGFAAHRRGIEASVRDRAGALQMALLASPER